MRYLAIDPGERRTGLALGDDITGIVTPLTTIDTTSATERLRRIGRAIDAQGPDVLVVGLPLNMDGSAGPAAQRSRTFGEQLAQQFNLPVRYADERLSSAAADEQMARSGLTRQGKKQRRDALAAAAILRELFST